MVSEEIKKIRRAIREKGYQWSAGKTTMSELSEEEREKRLGVILDEEDKETMEAEWLEKEALAASEGITYVYPPEWDWRNVHGRDWTTPVKDQGRLSTCVAFAVVAAVESNYEIFRRDPYLNLDLSEADLFYGGGGDPEDGWYFSPALRRAQIHGIPDEECLPYDPSDPQPYNPCPDRDKRTIKIENSKLLGSPAAAKEWIYRYGPVMVIIEKVPEDIYYYRAGIYQHAWGKDGGKKSHAICIVGYNEQQQCWIFKNSWGTGWGENGWGRIKYSECGYAFRAVEFPFQSDSIYMPKGGKVTAEFLSKETGFDDEFLLYTPRKKLIFQATDLNVGKIFDVGKFRYPQRLAFALKTPEGFTYYTDHFLNPDGCRHVLKTQKNKYTWELRWEDLCGLGDRDYNDVVVKIKIHPQ